MGVILRVLLILSGVGILSMAAATPSANAQAAWGRAHGTSHSSPLYGGFEGNARYGTYHNVYTFLPLPVMVESQWDLFPGQPPSGPAAPAPGLTTAPDAVGTVVGGPGQLIAGQSTDHVSHHPAHHLNVGLQAAQGQAPVSNQVAADDTGSSQANLAAVQSNLATSPVSPPPPGAPGPGRPLPRLSGPGLHGPGQPAGPRW